MIMLRYLRELGKIRCFVRLDPKLMRRDGEGISHAKLRRSSGEGMVFIGVSDPSKILHTPAHLKNRGKEDEAQPR